MINRETAPTQPTYCSFVDHRPGMKAARKYFSLANAVSFYASPKSENIFITLIHNISLYMRGYILRVLQHTRRIIFHFPMYKVIWYIASERLILSNKIAWECPKNCLDLGVLITLTPRAIDGHSLRKHAGDHKYAVRALLKFMFNLLDRCNCIIYRYR